MKGLPANVNLTFVLPTVQGLADRPGEAPGLGVIDPALSRTLADAAARNDRSTFCLTGTNSEGSVCLYGERSRTRAPGRRPNGTGSAGRRENPGPSSVWTIPGRQVATAPGT